MNESRALEVGSRSGVGVPTHELVLHDALAKLYEQVVQPGPGRSAYYIPEPELGFGRADGLILVISPAALKVFYRKKLRLPSLSAAQSLGAQDNSNTAAHSRQLARRLASQGWSETKLHAAAKMVSDSLSVEAKMSDWRRAIRQATGYRVMTGRSAILIPDAISHRVNEQNLAAHGVGMLVAGQRKIEWAYPAPRTAVGDARRAWLVELLLRHLETNDPQRLA
jgi:hypothetical protein